MTVRLFIGDLDGMGDYRARISKVGFDASDPDTLEANLDFDSAWPFAGKLHAAGMAFPASTNDTITVNFPELPYIPAVFTGYYTWLSGGGSVSTPSNAIRLWMGAGDAVHYQTVIHPDKLVATPDPTGGPVPGGNSLGLYYLVFRIPMLDVDVSEIAAPPRPRVLIGKRGANYGFYVSRKEFNVLTCSDEQLVFSSDEPPDINLFEHFSWEMPPSTGSFNGFARRFPITNQGYHAAVLAFGATDELETMILPLWRMNDSLNSGGPNANAAALWSPSELAVGTGNVSIGKFPSGTIIFTDTQVVVP